MPVQTDPKNVMGAAVVTGHGGLDKIVYRYDYPRPQIGARDVLVRIRATALNYHDIFTRRGMPGIRIPLPVITGSDMAGEIVEVGEGVEGWEPGDRVLIDPALNDDDIVGLMGEITDGGRAQFLRARDYQLIRLADGVTFEQAAALPLAYGTAHKMMFSVGKVTAGEKVLVLGASGGVGVACVQLAKAVGAEVVACASTGEKLDKLKALGADHLVNYAEQDFMRAVHDVVGRPRVFGTGGVDVVVNFTGGDTWAPSVRCLKVGGRLLNCGATAGYDVTMDLRYIWTFGLRIIGSSGWTREDLTTLLEMVAQSRLAPVIDCTLPLDQAREAEAMMEDRRFFGKILLAP